MELTREEKDLIVEGLLIRKNLIETGDPVLSANDAFERGIKIRPLDRHQRDTINNIEDIIKKIQPF